MTFDCSKDNSFSIAVELKPIKLASLTNSGGLIVHMFLVNLHTGSLVSHFPFTQLNDSGPVSS